MTQTLVRNRVRHAATGPRPSPIRALSRPNRRASPAAPTRNNPDRPRAITLLRYRTEIVVPPDRYVCLQLPAHFPEGRATVTVLC